VEWLRDLWEALGGPRPPASLEVIVAGEPGAWAAGPAEGSTDEQRWHALRLTLLYHIWAARCSGDSAQCSAHAVVCAAVAAVRADIRLQYNRQYCAVQQQRHLPARQLAMRRLKAAPSTFEVWLHPRIAQLDTDTAPQPAAPPAAPPAAAPQPQPAPAASPPALKLLLDVDSPVPAPPPPPPPPPRDA
jgi:hypothetical protein